MRCERGGGSCVNTRSRVIVPARGRVAATPRRRRSRALARSTSPPRCDLSVAAAMCAPTPLVFLGLNAYACLVAYFVWHFFDSPRCRSFAIATNATAVTTSQSNTTAKLPTSSGDGNNLVHAKRPQSLARKR